MTGLRKINLDSKDIVEERVEQLLKLFPEVSLERERESKRER